MPPVLAMIIESLPNHLHYFRKCHHIVCKICYFWHLGWGRSPWIIAGGFSHFDLQNRVNIKEKVSSIRLLTLWTNRVSKKTYIAGCPRKNGIKIIWNEEGLNTCKIGSLSFQIENLTPFFGTPSIKVKMCHLCISIVVGHILDISSEASNTDCHPD